MTVPYGATTVKPTPTLGGRYYYSHFANEELETQRGKVVFLGSRKSKW